MCWPNSVWALPYNRAHANLHVAADRFLRGSFADPGGLRGPTVQLDGPSKVLVQPAERRRLRHSRLYRISSLSDRLRAARGELDLDQHFCAVPGLENKLMIADFRLMIACFAVESEINNQQSEIRRLCRGATGVVDD